MPIPVLSIAQMREWEKATWATGRTETEVIERVGKLVAKRAQQLVKPGGKILLLAGKGHNGDDVRAAQTSLQKYEVVLLNVTEPAEIYDLRFTIYDLIVDGLFGIGLNRPLDENWQKLINAINDANVPILSVDTPSGLNGDTGEPQGAAIRATVTLAIGAPKRGLHFSKATEFAGRLEVASDIGLIPCPCASEWQWILPEDFSRFPPPRPVATHKGTFGHLAIIAGSLGYHGAAVLAARGALRAQPGLVTLFTSENVFLPVASQMQAAMVHPWKPETVLPENDNGASLRSGFGRQRFASWFKR